VLLLFVYDISNTYNLHSSFNHQIMTRQNRTLTLTLTGNVRAGVNRNLGTLSIQAEETVASKTVAEINFRCVNLDNKDLFSKSVRTNLCILVLLGNNIMISCRSFNLLSYFLFLGSFLKNIKSC